MKLLIGSKVLFLFCLEICTPEGRGGEKRENANFKTNHTEPLTQGVPPALYSSSPVNKAESKKQGKECEQLMPDKLEDAALPLLEEMDDTVDGQGMRNGYVIYTATCFGLKPVECFCRAHVVIHIHSLL